MEAEIPFEKQIELAETQGSLEDVSELISKLFAQNDDRALDLCLQLAMSEFGGITYKDDFQNIAALGALHWGTKGIARLGKAAIKTNSFRSISNATRLLSHISSKALSDFMYSRFNLKSVIELDLSSDKYKTEEWTKTAKETLIDVVKSVETEEKFPIGITNNLGFAINENAAEHVFAALIARWFNFSSTGLQAFLHLVNNTGRPEIEYQNFLKANPYILEPFHAQIWSKPKFGEDLIPDFLIRSMDNTYTVVEIEQADFPIMTKAGELSAKTTHAKRQAMDFRDWAINNNLYASKKFPGIYRPYCLVVIGREAELDEMQTQRLKQENESTQGILKIVGFDWLLNRARTTLDNLVNFGFDRHTFQEAVSE
ncbi:Shedu anti-phage system protein SduA domain-containing protein [Spirosoma panaciterrae]|uniref:Shedu anti-phage system protein SduA domain-containing protein n=1 Tax=Spirosoma panaciterrae TaxID=496058 RepID=UPI00037A2CAF|nr:Shedu anti-phage system protein SduA domain-containing protein [Spirosoma panaciterrae]